MLTILNISYIVMKRFWSLCVKSANSLQINNTFLIQALICFLQSSRKDATQIRQFWTNAEDDANACEENSSNAAVYGKNS
jgi:hypothetical protein